MTPNSPLEETRPEPPAGAPAPMAAAAPVSLAACTAELHALQGEMQAIGRAVFHDLRGPLMNIGGFADLLQEHAGAQLDDKGRQYLGKIISSVNKLNEMVNGILAQTRERKFGLVVGPPRPDPSPNGPALGATANPPGLPGVGEPQIYP